MDNRMGLRLENFEQSIPERFEEIVRRFADRAAITAGDRIVTYAELNAMANRIAHEIIDKRGSCIEPVALLVGKGIEQVAAMLGILKAGKFFVQLPGVPEKRIIALLRNSSAKLAIVDEESEALIRRRRFDCQVIRAHSLRLGQSEQNPQLRRSSGAIACVVYTSGSTGRPKGVVRDHRGLMHGAMLRVHTDGISEIDRLAHITSGTANAVTNSFYVLLQGAMLVLFDVKKQGVIRLAQWLDDEQITICLIASPVFRNLCRSFTGAEKFSALRYLRLRSDAVYKSDVELHRRYFPPSCLLATGLASSETGPLREFRIGRDTELPTAEVPVGYALPDKEIFLVDDHGQELGFNQIGEIVVRSGHLALGYWQDPDLTAEKFKPDPRDASKRLFYTGDLGSMRPDGCLFHKGRKDSRLKVRGYGVDVTEVENALRSLEGIRDVIVAPTREQEDRRLVAYYTTQGTASPTVKEMAEHLRKQLAHYSIPAAFVSLAEMPLTSNGKIDRAALPDPPKTRPETGTAYVPPRTITEEKLATFWAEALGIDRVGIHDNFFDLGAHSLTAMRVALQVTTAFRVELPLESLLQASTVAAMAALIVEQQGKTPADPILVKMLEEVESMSEEEAQRMVTKGSMRTSAT
jgi:acyl-coenzyme A synthetase/AMP-(fatty) acid ligase/acyl carrier protein